MINGISSSIGLFNTAGEEDSLAVRNEGYPLRRCRDKYSLSLVDRDADFIAILIVDKFSAALNADDNEEGIQSGKVLDEWFVNV